MSYYDFNPFGVRRPEDVMESGCKNPLLPKDCYKPGAAGPRHLTLDGYAYRYQGQPSNLQGLGAGLDELLSGELVAEKLAAKMVEKGWPMVEPKIKTVAQTYATYAAIAVGGLALIGLATLYSVRK